MNQLNLNNTQKILFVSALAAIIVQVFCIFCFLEKKHKFDICNCAGYIIFSAFSYICYYKLVIP